jgi:hypothetical protein
MRYRIMQTYYRKQIFEGRIYRSLPRVHENRIIGVGKASVLDQILEVAVRSSTPSLHRAVSTLANFTA